MAAVWRKFAKRYCIARSMRARRPPLMPSGRRRKSSTPPRHDMHAAACFRTGGGAGSGCLAEEKVFENTFLRQVTVRSARWFGVVGTVDHLVVTVAELVGHQRAGFPRESVRGHIGAQQWRYAGFIQGLEQVPA